MTATIVQPGLGVFRDVVLLYSVPRSERPAEFLWPEACVLAEQEGPFAMVGDGDIEALGKAVLRARREAGPFSVRGVILIGFGGGCRAVREQIRDGARPDVVVALDGVSGPPGPIPPDEYYLGPWRVTADRARRDECLAIFTHTSQTYMEALPHGERYPSPLTALREVTDIDLVALAPSEHPSEQREHGLVVRSYPSHSFDREAHANQRTLALPNIVKDLVLPWLRDMDFTPTSLPRWQA